MKTIFDNIIELLEQILKIKPNSGLNEILVAAKSWCNNILTSLDYINIIFVLQIVLTKFIQNDYNIDFIKKLLIEKINTDTSFDASYLYYKYDIIYNQNMKINFSKKEIEFKLSIDGLNDFSEDLIKKSNPSKIDIRNTINNNLKKKYII
jgi:hypothetical protein